MGHRHKLSAVPGILDVLGRLRCACPSPAWA
jgi:hypothetical protein